VPPGAEAVSPAACFSLSTSALVSSRCDPTGRRGSAIDPNRTRRSRTTGWPIASHMFLTWRDRPSCSTIEIID
jgi:hypothetical protein